ncbi:BTAD domain-containing putative transcriptional regulator [Streptomyces sp. NPDC056486]|uniref:BTAD domain-containing putative transcriptional regulator n=1 Tax=Streptomyces sp. NPDC056486 TaxID=3345835 RepID=UPI0036ABEA13
MPTPIPPSHVAHRLVAAVRFLVSGSALTAAVAGIPYILSVTVGGPWPAQVSSLADLLRRLAQPVSDPFILQVLALVGWICWTYFIAVLLRETLWLLGRMPSLVADGALLRRRTATLPAHRAAAALLVGTLLLALIGMWRLPAAHAAAAAAGPTSSAVAAAAPQHVPPTRAAKAEYTAYTVRSGDTLWDIAEEHLGDPLLWPKIYQLSCTIRQSDGRLLSDPDLIMPGWQLRLPQIDAPAPAPVPASPRPPADPPPPTPPLAPEPAGQQPHGHDGRHDERRDEQRQPGRQERRHSQVQERGPAAISLGVASAIGVTTAAGIAAAIGFARWHAARRRVPRLETLATPLADDDLLLSDALERSNQAHLATLAARHHNPEAVPRRTAPAEPQQPGTVTVAEHSGVEVGVDSLAVPGGVHLTGPGADAAVRHLVIAIASAAERLRPAPSWVQLITPRATLCRLLPTAAHAALAAWTVTDTATEAFERAEHVLIEATRHEQGLGAPALARSGSALHVLLVDGAGDDPARLHALAAGDTRHLAVIALGPDSARGNRLAIAADGTANGPLTAFDNATMFLLAPDVATEFLDTLYAAHGRRTGSADSDDEPEGERAPEQVPAPVPQQPSPASGPAAAAPTHELYIRLLGGFKLFVHGKECALADTRKEETREFIALLAAHRDGLRGEEIAEKMQLSDDPVSARAEIENLRRSARRVFRGATGKKEVAFVLLSGQVHKLDPQYITTDTAAFTDALRQAAAADSTYARADALGRATDIYTGPLCDGSDYLWAHGHRAALHRSALDALMLLAEHVAQHSADAEPALALLNQAADLDPENERVYRRIIQLQLALGRDDAAHRTLGLLTERLAAIDAEPEAATLALLRESAPPRRGALAPGASVRR